MPNVTCAACMVNVSNMPASQKVFPKAYACAQYCQEPALATTRECPHALMLTAVLGIHLIYCLLLSALAASECSTCVGSKFPYDPYACSLCLTVGGSNDTNRQSCFTCVQSDPYNGTTSNYNW